MIQVSSVSVGRIGALVCLFLIIDSCILAMNMWLSDEIEQDATEINLAGRQRMLTQRLTKLILLDQPNETAGLAKLQSTADQFDSTLTAFLEGGEVESQSGALATVRAVTDPASRQTLTKARGLWAPVYTAIDSVAAPGEDFHTIHIREIRELLIQNNEMILFLMDQLTESLESAAKSKTGRIRQYQSIAMALATINFIVILIVFYRNLRVYRQGHDFLSSVINRVAVSVIVTDRVGTIDNCNYQAATMFGFTIDELKGQNIQDLIIAVEGESVGWRRDGSSFFVDVTQNKIDVDDADLYINTVRDVSRQKLTEQSLTRLAYLDPLTRLPNRTLVMERLSQEVARAHRGHESFMVCFVDLDDFKQINDELGHDAGDEVLREVSRRLKSCVRESDTVGRLGGDEFVVLLTTIGGQDDAVRLIEKLRESLLSPKRIGGEDVTIRASIGAAVYPDNAHDGASLLKLADTAMYHAKNAGKHRYCLYGEGIDMDSLSSVQRRNIIKDMEEL